MKNFFKQIVVDVVSAVGITFFTSYFALTSVNYISWIVLSIKVTIIGLLVIVAVNAILYRRYIEFLFSKMRKIWERSAKNE